MTAGGGQWGSPRRLPTDFPGSPSKGLRGPPPGLEAIQEQRAATVAGPGGAGGFAPGTSPPAGGFMQRLGGARQGSLSPRKAGWSPAKHAGLLSGASSTASAETAAALSLALPGSRPDSFTGRPPAGGRGAGWPPPLALAPHASVQQAWGPVDGLYRGGSDAASWGGLTPMGGGSGLGGWQRPGSSGFGGPPPPFLRHPSGAPSCGSMDWGPGTPASATHSVVWGGHVSGGRRILLWKGRFACFGGGWRCEGSLEANGADIYIHQSRARRCPWR